MITKNQSNKNLMSLESIDETELCSKIQRLMTNIKQHYKIEKSFGFDKKSQINERNNILISPINTSNSLIETNSDSDIGEITSSSILLNDIDFELNENEQQFISFASNENNLKENWKIQTSNSNPENLNFKNLKLVNLVPQRTLEKIMTLEKLILNFDESIERKTTPNEKVKMKLTDLLKEFNDVKMKLEKGSSNELMESEIVELMKRLKVLFENFYKIQDECTTNSITDKDCEQESMKRNYSHQPIIPPRKIDKARIFKETFPILNITSSSEDLFSVPNTKSNFQKIKPNFLISLKSRSNLSKIPMSESENISNYEKKYEQKFPEEINDFEKSSGSLFNDDYNETNELSNQVQQTHNLHPIEFDNVTSDKFLQKNSLSLDVLPRNDLLKKPDDEIFQKLNEKSKKINEKITEAKPKIKTRISKSVNNLFQTNEWHKKTSRLPILKKEYNDGHFNSKIREISSISQTITHQVMNNLKQMGYLSIEKSEMIKSHQIDDKTKTFTKITKGKTKIQPVKNIEEFVKLPTDAIYLTKLNSYRSKNVRNDFATDKNSTCSHSRIYNLEKLLKRKKYKLIESNKINLLKSGDTIIENNGSTNSLFQHENKIKNEMEENLDKIMSSIGNSPKIINQIIFFPSKAIELEANEIFGKIPRLANIENICSCKIKILINEELMKRKLKPIRDLVVFEITYDLRKGKALGCINMLRHLAGQRNKEIKIYRSSILLPGGYIQELSCCSINELVNLSMQINENSKIHNLQFRNSKLDNNSNKIKFKSSTNKQKRKIVKTFSMGCIESS